MRRRAVAVLAVLAMGSAARAQGGEPAWTGITRGETAPVEYARASAWICRPGQDEATCAGALDAMAIDPAGTRTPAPFKAASAPPIDCFYVYPTTSDDPTFYSDLAPDASEKQTVHAQAARLSSVCRLFAPVYHQVTSAGLRWRMSGGGASGTDVIGDINGVPYRDVRDAWRSYLARDNGGRGVVLVGHSQGAILLKKLIAEEVDGKPARHLLVGAYLAGNPNLGSASFRAIRPCRASGETGCLVAWSSYGTDYRGERNFGGSREGAPICVNPAALSGGRAPLKSYLSRPNFAPAGDPPYVESVGQLTAECETDASGAVLRVRAEPGRYGDLMAGMLTHSVRRPTWGLHPLDISLVQGDMIDDIAAQGAAWMRGRP